MERATIIPATTPYADPDHGDKRPRPQSLSYVFSKLTFASSKRATINDLSPMSDKRQSPHRPFHPSAMLDALRWSNQDSQSSSGSKQMRRSMTATRFSRAPSHEGRNGSSSSSSTFDPHINWTPPATDWQISHSRNISADSHYDLNEDDEEDDDDDAKSDILYSHEENQLRAKQESIRVYRSPSTMVHPALRQREIITPPSSCPSSHASPMAARFPGNLPPWRANQAGPSSTAASSQTKLDASGPPRTDFYMMEQNSILPPRPNLTIRPSQESALSSATATAASSPPQRFNLLLGGPVHSFYGGNSSGDKVVLSQAGYSQNDPQHNTQDGSSPIQSYQQLVNTYRSLAEPRMSVFDDDDDDEGQQNNTKERQKPEDAAKTRFAPRTPFWNKMSNGRLPPSPESPTRTSQQRRAPSSYYHRTHKSLRGRASAVWPTSAADHTKSDSSLSSRRANGNLVISAPMAMDQATYVAVVRDHKDAITASPSASSLASPVSSSFAPVSTPPRLQEAAAIATKEEHAARRPWHHKLSPRKLGVSMDDMRASVLHRVGSNKRKSGIRESDKSRQVVPRVTTPDMHPGESQRHLGSADGPAEADEGAVAGEERDGARMHSKNFSVFLDKIRQQNIDKQYRRRTQVLRGEIQHVAAMDTELVAPSLDTLSE